MTEPTRVCRVCKEEFPATTEYFHKMPHAPYGVRYKCKDCVRKIQKITRSTPEYKEKARKRAAEWRKKNPQKTLEINRRCYHKNAERINKKRRERYKTDEEFRRKKIDAEKRYKESGRRYEINAKPEQREKARIRSINRRKDPFKNEHDRNRDKEWRKNNKELLEKIHRETREQLKPSYVAASLRIKVGDMTKEVYENRKTIILIKRELKKQNVKIK